MAEEALDKWEFENEGFRYSQVRGQDGYYHASLAGTIDEQSALRINSLVERAYQSEREKIVYIMDMNHCREITAVARRHLSTYFLSDDTRIKVFASFGGSFYMRSLVNLYTRIATAVPFRSFKEEDEALRWVAQELSDV